MSSTSPYHRMLPTKRVSGTQSIRLCFNLTIHIAFLWSHSAQDSSVIGVAEFPFIQLSRLRVWSLPENADTNKGEATSTGSRTPPAKSCRKSPKCIPSTSQLTRLDIWVWGHATSEEISNKTPHVSIDTPFKVISTGRRSAVSWWHQLPLYEVFSTCVYWHTLHPHIPPIGVHRSPRTTTLWEKKCLLFVHVYFRWDIQWETQWYTMNWSPFLPTCNNNAASWTFIAMLCSCIREKNKRGRDI